MEDDDVDALLRSAGDDFRLRHNRPAHVLRRARRRWLALPLVAAAAAAAAVVAVAFVVPDRQPGPSVADPAPSASVADPTASPSAVPARETVVQLTLPDITSVELDETWLAVAGGELGQKTRGRIEVRRRNNPRRVAATITTSYPYGGMSCLQLNGDQLLWTDIESVPSNYDPGPPTRWSIWQRDLRTGAQQRLTSGLPKSSSEDVPCPVAGAGRAAWQLGKHVIVRSLETGAEQTFADDATPVAFTAAGLMEASWRDRGVQLLLRAGKQFATRRSVINVDRGTSLSIGGDRLLVFTVDAGSESADAGIVSTCELPKCSTLTELRRDPASGPGVVGNGFAAWNDLGDAAMLIRFDGQPAPALAPGYVPFQTLAAFGNTFVYGTQQRDANASTPGPTTLHLMTMENLDS